MGETFVVLAHINRAASRGSSNKLIAALHRLASSSIGSGSIVFITKQDVLYTTGRISRA